MSDKWFRSKVLADGLSVLIWIQTVYKGYHHTTKNKGKQIKANNV